MTRGVRAKIGDESVINGYIYVKISEHEWKPKARLVVEEHIGRLLTDDEYVLFEDKNPKNFDISNLKIRMNRIPIDKRIERLKSKIAKLNDELANLEAIRDNPPASPTTPTSHVYDRSKTTKCIVCGATITVKSKGPLPQFCNKHTSADLVNNDQNEEYNWHVEAVQDVEPIQITETTCFYCGEYGISKDHILPANWFIGSKKLSKTKRRNSHRANVPTVRACTQCNSILNDKLMPDLRDRLEHIINRLTEKGADPKRIDWARNMSQKIKEQGSVDSI